MKLTTLFRLRKPDGTDPVNIEDFNDNFDVIDEELGKRLESTGNASDMTTAFTQASTRTNLKTGEKISASFGKIMKWFADMKTVAFSGSYSDLSNKPSIPSGAAASQAVANNCTTTAAGSVLDARQGKVLMDKANQLNSEMASVKQSFQDGCNTLVNKCQSIGITPASNSPTDIANAIQQIRDGSLEAGRQQVTGNPNNYNLFTADQYNNNYNNGYNAGFSAGEAAASYSVEDISSKLSAYASQNHGFRSSVSLSGYKYIIVCATYQSGKTANFSSFSGCKCLAQTSWTAYGASTSIAVSEHLIILSDITGAVNVSASSTGTGNVSVRAFGFK